MTNNNILINNLALDCDFTIYGDLVIEQDIQFVANQLLMSHKWFIDDMIVGTFSTLNINFSIAKDYVINHEGMDQYYSWCSVIKIITITSSCTQPSTNLTITNIS